MPRTVHRVDVHQHLWPEGLLALLARRTAPPRLRRAGAAWLVDAPGEPASVFDPAAHDPARRAALAAQEGLGRVLVAPSCPLGIEALDPAEAQPLLDAHLEGVLAAGAPFAPWGALALGDPDPDRVGAQLEAGAAGLALPAGALASPEGLERLGPALERLGAHGAPLLVHPGPGGGGPDAPGWWPGMTGYVAQMGGAWHAWAHWGRRQHPGLLVVFAMLAGLAPLHGERLALRGGPTAALHDPRTVFDTSSYGPVAVDTMLRVVGVDRLLHGTDQPVVGAHGPEALGPAAAHALTAANPARLLAPAALPVAA